MRTIAKRRAGLDAEEARWLREADRCEIWRELGMVSVLDYIERTLGYSPQVATERLRVAYALEDLPGLSEALACGQLPYSAVREMTRIVTPETERTWCDSTIGKNVHQIEGMVSGHEPGDLPDDPINPKVQKRVMRFEISAETFALYRQVHQLLDEEHGRRLSGDELMAAVLGAVLDRGGEDTPTGRAKFQIAMTVCKRCQQGWQEGAGAQVAVDASTVERARCDAQEIGSIDGAEPERARQDVSPSVMRLVSRRDGGRCRVPGCRSARSLETHHIVHREHGGSHEASNLILLCSSCHVAHHRGKLKISGTASALVVERCTEFRAGPLDVERRAERRHPHAGASQLEEAHGTERRSHAGASQLEGARSAERRPHVGAGQLEGARSAVRCSHAGVKSAVLAASVTCAQAKEALVRMGWKPKIATAAVRAAASEIGQGVAIEKLIFEALRRCPRPVS